MSEYPEDIRKACDEIIEKHRSELASALTNVLLMRQLICAALLAERKRSAKIASNEADRICDNDNDYSGPRVFDMLVTARRIQFAISGEPNIHLSDDVRARITKTSEDAA